MPYYYIVHRDEHGEPHQLTGAWEADTPEGAIAQMLAESGGADDGAWEAYVVTSPADVIGPYFKDVGNPDTL